MENQASDHWLNPAWQARVTVEVCANGFERHNKPAELELNFTEVLRSAGIEGPLSTNALRVVEVGAQGEIIDSEVLSQFDPAEDFEAAANARGVFSWLVKGATGANETRRYQLYFGVAGRPYPTAVLSPLVRVTENVVDEEQLAYQIETQNATYFYQKIAGGFSSLLDREGFDWIGYRPGGGSAGEYRGIPNVYPYGFHPGYDNAHSCLLSRGPLKVRIFSETNDQQATCVWDIYPTYATMTLLRIGEEPYWVLYEGTPGGKFDPETDYLVHANGHRRSASEVWDEVLPDPEWLYFGSGKTDRVLYCIHHETDDIIDAYWPMQGNMTVFGFGRTSKGGTTYIAHMKAVPAHFTYGFSEENDHQLVTKIVNSAHRALHIRIGQPEKRV